jgi:hypothetical protein
VVVLVVARCCLNALTVGSLHVSPTSKWRLLHMARGRSCWAMRNGEPVRSLGSWSIICLDMTRQISEDS